MRVNFMRLDGTEDTAHVTTRKLRSGYYVGIVRIGNIRKRVTRQKVVRADALFDAEKALWRYADNAVI